MEPFVLRARRSVPRLGIEVGDTIVVRDGSPALWRSISNPGAVLLAHEDGALEIVSSPDEPPSLREAVGFHSPGLAVRRHRPRVPGRLNLVP